MQHHQPPVAPMALSASRRHMSYEGGDGHGIRLVQLWVNIMGDGVGGVPRFTPNPTKCQLARL
jgi:hypothetical protein